MKEEMNSCVICGAYTPEGRQICHACAWKYGLESSVGIETMSAADLENSAARAALRKTNGELQK